MHKTLLCAQQCNHPIHQYGKQAKEYREFAKVMFNNFTITVAHTLKYLQFQAHREKQVTLETLDEAVARAGKKRKRKSKRMKKTNSTKASTWHHILLTCGRSTVGGRRVGDESSWLTL